jgi:hypothetical protein
MAASRIFWKGDFSNEARWGVVVSNTNGMLTIEWDKGGRMAVPEFTTKNDRWSRV